MAAVQPSSWNLPFFDNAWFFKLNKYVCSCSNASPVVDKVTPAADFVSSSEQYVNYDFANDLLSRSTVLLVGPSKDYHSPREDKPTLSRESARSGHFEEMKRVFQTFDENTDDRICAKDLRRYMARLGYSMSEEEARSLVASVDRDGDGSVDFDEFFSLYLSLVEHQEDDEEETLLEAFQVFDKNANGFITARELQAVLLDLGMSEGKSLRTCEDMIRSVAGDGSGEIDISQFKQMMGAPSLMSTKCY